MSIAGDLDHADSVLRTAYYEVIASIQAWLDGPERHWNREQLECARAIARHITHAREAIERARHERRAIPL